MTKIEVTTKLDLHQCAAVIQLRWLKAVALDGPNAIVMSEQALNTDMSRREISDQLTFLLRSLTDVRFNLAVLMSPSPKINFTLTSTSISDDDSDKLISITRHADFFTTGKRFDYTVPYVVPSFVRRSEFALLLWFTIVSIKPLPSKEQYCEIQAETMASNWQPDPADLYALNFAVVTSFAVVYEKYSENVWCAKITIHPLESLTAARMLLVSSEQLTEKSQNAFTIYPRTDEPELCSITYDALEFGEEVLQCKKCLNMGRLHAFVALYNECRTHNKPFSCPICQTEDLKNFQRGHLTKRTENFYTRSWMTFFWDTLSVSANKDV
jgi:hypothetical protein